MYSGLEKLNLGFLLCDKKIVDDVMLEDLNKLLTSG